MTIGFVIPAWNAVRWIRDTLQSLVDQSSHDWRAVVVDDGSTDQTGDVSTGFRRKRYKAAARIDTITIPHSGLARAVNSGLDHLYPKAPDLIACCGSDDRLSEHYVRDLLDAFKQKPALMCAFPRVQEFGIRVKEWRPGAYAPGLLAETNLVPGCAAWRRQVWQQLGGFDPRFTAGFEDWHFAARAELAGIIGPYNVPKFVPDAVYYHRAREDSLTDTMPVEYRAWATREIGALFSKPSVAPFVHVPQSKAAAIVRGPFNLRSDL